MTALQGFYLGIGAACLLFALVVNRSLYIERKRLQRERAPWKGGAS